ncbi:hypothetical protein VF13_42225, partial [Nostoc linckia z16]
PVNGVKVIGRNILENFSKEHDLVTIDTSQAIDYKSFGKFNAKKIFFLFHLLHAVKKIKVGEKVLMNLSVNGFSFYRDAILVSFLKLQKADLTLHIHANGLENKNRLLVKKLLDNVKVIVLNSRQYEELGFVNKLYCIPNSLPDYYGKQPVCKTLSGSPRSFLYMSNLSEKKGTARLLEVCDYIATHNIPARITICGGLLDKKAEIALETIQKNYKFVNYVGPVEDLHLKMQLYNEHDFLLFLSDQNYEVYPLVYIEALMSGLPIITTQQAVSEDIIANGCGYIFEKERIEFYTSEQLTQHLPELQDACRKKYEKHYDFDNYCSRLINVISNG